MTTAKFKFDAKNYQIKLDGDFEFKMSDEIIDDITCLDDKKNVYFELIPNLMKEIKLYCEDDLDKYYNLIGDKIKTNFINFLKTI